MRNAESCSPEPLRRHSGQDVMTLMAEYRPVQEGLAMEGLRKPSPPTLQAVMRMRGDVRLVDPGTLPNDGRVIAEARGTP